MNRDLSTCVVDSLLGMAVVIFAGLGWERGFRRTVNLAGVSGAHVSPRSVSVPGTQQTVVLQAPPPDGGTCVIERGGERTCA